MMWRGESEARAADLARAIEEHAVERVLDCLERGGLMGPMALGVSLGIVQADRLRALRTQLVKHDLYALLYGELPDAAVDPDVRDDPLTPRTGEEAV